MSWESMFGNVNWVCTRFIAKNIDTYLVLFLKFRDLIFTGKFIPVKFSSCSYPV